MAIVGPLLTSYSPNAIDLSQRLSPPSAVHWFGTDELGRDLFARVAHGGRYSILAALAVVALTLVVGSAVGALAALSPRPVEFAIMRVTDILLSIPALVLALALAAALGPGLLNAIIALSIARIPTYIRIARNQSIVLRGQAFMQAAWLYGAPPSYRFVKHLAPNIAPVLLTQALADMGGMMLAIAAVGFIGLGAQPPTPEWGALAASGRLFFLECWWYAAFPALAIIGSATGFNLVGDALRDLADPRTQSEAR
ncbi:MAG: ABC transporter permease subunit [Alphaproteobacteria bacterium]|nr:ABC transporter permease subunit [Alphaproteobacteria bacterium]